MEKNCYHIENDLVFIKNLASVFRLLETVASTKPFLYANNMSTEGDRYSGSGFLTNTLI